LDNDEKNPAFSLIWSEKHNSVITYFCDVISLKLGALLHLVIYDYQQQYFRWYFLHHVLLSKIT